MSLTKACTLVVLLLIVCQVQSLHLHRTAAGADNSAALRGVKAPASVLPPFSTDPHSPPLAANVSSAIEAAVESMFASQRAKDCNSFVGLFATNFSVVDPFGAPAITNSSELMASCEASNQAFKTVTIFPEITYTAGFGAGVVWSVKSVTNAGCQLDFTGIDAVLFDSDIKIVSVQGFFDAETAAHQMNCSSA